MKYPKKNNMLKYVLFFVGIVVIFLVVRKIQEGFQTVTTVNLYFTIDATNKPTLVKSTDPRVKYVSSAITSAVISIDPSLGPLNSFNGSGWSQAGRWIPLTGSKLDYSTNALNIKEPNGSGTRYLHNPAYNRPMLTTGVEVKLPQTVTNITLGGLSTATFGLGTNAGDTANNNAKILVTLNF